MAEFIPVVPLNQSDTGEQIGVEGRAPCELGMDRQGFFSELGCEPGFDLDQVLGFHGLFYSKCVCF